MAHARLSPSSAERWMTCPGSVPLSDGVVDEGSDFAAEGTAAHELSERILLGADGATLVGQKAENGVEWTADMLRDVQPYITAVRDIVASTGGKLLIEQKVPVGHLTGEGKWVDELTGEPVAEGANGAVWEPAYGTSDAVIIAGNELIVGDLKFGRGVVVEADANRQLMIYALGALERFDLALGPFERVRLFISQPRLGALSEWSCSVEELLAFGEEVKQAAAHVEFVTLAYRDGGVASLTQHMQPGEKACKFCKVKGNCPKLQSEVLDLFESIDPRADIVVHSSAEEADAPEFGKTTVAVVDLATAMSKLPMIEGWIKAVRARVESELLAGRDVPGYKLVQGREGNRKWADPVEAETMLKGFRLKTEQMYEMSLISPTAAEKLAKDKTIGPRQWTKAQALITRPEGQPSVAPASDKRPALQRAVVADEFEDLPPDTPPAETATVDDLL